VTRSFLFILSSGRRDGNAERLARAAAAVLPAQTAQRWMALADFQLSPFEDRRHPTPDFPPPQGAELELLNTTLAASDIVMVAPVYWYSLPASAKLYLDYWTSWLRARADFKAVMAGKRLWAVSSISDSNYSGAAPLTECLRLSAEYMAMTWRGALIGEGNRPGDVENDARAMAAAKAFFDA
jgi:multimeric flavodoxin WrbA